MGWIRPERLPEDPERAQARRDARLVLLVARARLRGGEPLDLPRLAALAEDARLTPRLRVRAASMLARAWISAVATAAGRSGAPAPRAHGDDHGGPADTERFVPAGKAR